MIKRIRIISVDAKSDGIVKGMNVNVDVRIKKDENGKEIVEGDDIYFEFTWKAVYNPEQGTPYIKIDGEIVGSYSNAQDIVKNWTPENPDLNVLNEVVRTAMQVSTIGGIFVSDVVRLPAPLPPLIPPITKTKKGKKD